MLVGIAVSVPLFSNQSAFTGVIAVRFPALGDLGSSGVTWLLMAVAVAATAVLVVGLRQPSEELVADELRVEDEKLSFEYRGVCGYGSTFDYAG